MKRCPPNHSKLSRYIFKLGFGFVNHLSLRLSGVIPASLLHLAEGCELHIVLLAENLEHIALELLIDAFVGEGVVDIGDMLLRAEDIVKYLFIGEILIGIHNLPPINRDDP